MESKTISIIAIVLFIFFGFFIWGYSGKGGTTASIQGVPGAASNSKSSLIAPEVFYDFGTISMKNGDVTKEFTVTNPTGNDIFLKTVLTSCMCTTAFIVEPDGSLKGPFKMPGMGYVPPANELIKAGESRTIRVVYNPERSRSGGRWADRPVRHAHRCTGGALQLEIKALVTP